MARTSRHLKGALEGRVDTALLAGGGSLAILAALAVGREGLETALFLWAAAQASGSTTEPLVGGALGPVTAVALGVLIYRGAVHLDLGKFFRWTGGVLVFVAAGVLAYGVHDLQEASILPGLHSLAFDVSDDGATRLVVRHPAQGHVQLLAATTWLQLAAWLLYVVPVLTLFVLKVRPPRPARSSPSASVFPRPERPTCIVPSP